MIDELRRELAAVGIRGRYRDRILAEVEDHLRCDPQAELGTARDLARQFADELAPAAARRAARWAFAALIVVASAVVGAQASLPVVPDIAGGRTALLGGPAAVAMIVGAQVAFASGCLAALRAWRRPEDVTLVRRRVVVALMAGALTTVGSALYAVNFWRDVPAWWALFAVAAAGAASAALVGAAAVYARAAQIVVPEVDAHGLSADLGPLAHPMLIGVGASAMMLVGTAVLERSFVEGTIRAAFEAALFAICFAVFRRPLALSD